MKNNGRFKFVAGFLCGAVIFGGSAAFAAGIAAAPTTSKVLVNGQEIHAEAYNIGGNNYFKLRDIASAVNFSVVYDSAGNRILIDTRLGYDPNQQYDPGKVPSAATVAPTVPNSLVATPAPSPQPAATAPAMTVDEMKAEIVRLTNEERARLELSALEVLPELMDCAQAKAQDFDDNHYFGHVSPQYGTPGDMIKAYVPKAKSCAENLAAWSRTPADAFNIWMHSTEHYNSMVNPQYTHIGIGVIEGIDDGFWYVAQYVKL